MSCGEIVGVKLDREGEGLEGYILRSTIAIGQPTMPRIASPSCGGGGVIPNLFLSKLV